MSSQYSALDIFNKWQKELSSDRYTAKGRRECLINLIESLLDNQVDFEDAKTLKSSFVGLTTKKQHRAGPKVSKKWKEDAAMEFDSYLADAYISKTEKTYAIQKKEDVNSGNIYFEPDDLIKKWLCDIIGCCGDDLVKEAHKVGSSLNISFINNYFYKK
jgi:hypothetical protein